MIMLKTFDPSHKGFARSHNFFYFNNVICKSKNKKIAIKIII
jgi:hypothetical protein